MRRIAPLLLVIALAATACAAQGADPDASPSRTVSAPVNSPTVSESAAPTSATFTPELLAALCAEKARDSFSDDITVLMDKARVEARTVTPPWLVLVPVTAVDVGAGTDSVMICTMGGTPEQPVFESYGGMPPLTEDEIQVYIHGAPDPGH